MQPNGPSVDDPVSISIFLDDATEPIASYKPPARFNLDTSTMRDGEHVLRIQAVDAVGTVGVRRIPFTVANGPGITVTGLRAGARVRGELEIDINAFGSDEPFDPVRAESAGPVPVWTWVFFAFIVGWAAWYGIEYFKTPDAFAQTPTYAANPALALSAPATQTGAGTPAPVGADAATGSKNVAGFDYTTIGARVYTQSCQACHGETGTGLPGAFPALAGNAVVNNANADDHIRIVLHGLSGKTIGGTRYTSQMPAFASQLTNAEIAAVVDHERTSWGNNGAIVTPEEVGKDR